MSDVLMTQRGPLHLPVFLPDATRGVVRAVDGGDLRATGVEAVVVNTFHLSSNPGCEAVAALGGIHAFMGFDGPIASDSGGFQLYSLLAENPRRGRITEKGFTYRHESGAEKKTLRPDTCIRKQFQLGADIVVCLDYCTHPQGGDQEQRTSVDHTIGWARQCRAAFDQLSEQTGRSPLIFAVVQGGNNIELRRRCAEQLVEIGFDGYGFGGWPIDDEGRLCEMVHMVAQLVPAESPKWALGIGKPGNVVAAVGAGYGLLDCVIPTRDARRQRLYALSGEADTLDLSDPSFYSCLYLQDRQYVRDSRPVDPTCDGPCCRHYSRAYLHHLFCIGDALAPRLATIHNLRFYSRLIEALRQKQRRGD